MAEWVESQVMKLGSDETLYTHEEGAAAVAEWLVKLVTDRHDSSGGRFADV